MNDERVEERLAELERRFERTEAEVEEAQQLVDQVATLLEGRLAAVERENAELRRALRMIEAASGAALTAVPPPGSWPGASLGRAG